MDNALKELIEKATLRGSRYIRGETALDEIPTKVAELGVFLLEKAGQLYNLNSPQLKEELISIQHRIDDMRKAIFSNKINL